MTGTIDFKKFTGEKLPNVEEYVRDYYKSHSNIEVMVGTDSQSKGARTCFSTIIAMYDCGDGEHGHGAHCIFRRCLEEADNNDLVLLHLSRNKM